MAPEINTGLMSNIGSGQTLLYHQRFLTLFFFLFLIKCVKTRSDEEMTMFFTSGTTGKAKMAEHTHASYGLGHFITGK